MKSKVHRALIASTLVLMQALAPVEAHAAAQAQQVVQVIMARCPTVVAQLLSRPELTTTTASRPIDPASVCSCTAANFAQDERMRAAFDSEPANIEQKLKSDKFKAYLFSRLLTSVFACLTPELEASLAGASLE